MISTKDRQIVITILESFLGIGSPMKSDEIAYHCPFCQHRKKKLQINIKSQKFHCWVCDARGARINSLLRKLNADVKSVQKIKEIYANCVDNYNPIEDYPEKLELPKEFKQLFKPPAGLSPHYNNAISYVKSRGLKMADIVKYNIGYCDGGIYDGRIIIPSYDENNELNYFVARSFIKNERIRYKNPPVSRNVILFENQINWNEPIVLVEGVFDSFSVKRNAIPLMGKYILKKLRDKILEKSVKELIIILDSDAVNDSIKHSYFFMKNDIPVKNIVLHDKDVADMGFFKINELIKNSKKTEWGDLILTKLEKI